MNQGVKMSGSAANALSQFDLQTMVAVAAAAISLVAALMSYMIAGRQTRIEVQSLKLATDTAIIGWANRCLALFAEIYEYARAPDSALFRERRIEYLHMLSSLVDEGRWFFPNVGSKDGDEDKESAFRGHRQPVLDDLVAAYRAVEELPPEACAARVYQARRDFVSDVQKVIDPHQRIRALERFSKL